MSDLQLSLLAIGVLVIVGVIVFNWWQERGYRKMAQQRFQSQGEDVLFRNTLANTPPFENRPTEDRAPETRIEPVVSAMDEAVPDEVLVEPVIEPAHAEPSYAEPPRTVDADASLPPQMDSAIDFIVRLELAEPVSAEDVRTALAGVQTFDKPSRWLGRIASGEWLDVTDARPSAEFNVVCGALQLADRSGPVSAESVAGFAALAQAAATALMAVAQMPERQPTLEQALALDEFCADVDVLVGVNVVAKDTDPFPGTKLRALAEASGLKLASDGTFQYRDERGVPLYSLTNHESAPFSADGIKQFTTHGITLLFDVPKVSNGVRGFDQMVQVARQFADSLRGTMVDDNLKSLSDDGIAKIKQQLSAIYAKMEARGIPAGGKRALRLFS